jgi:DNA-directed RNA polymerase specialized sigma24 family protein
LTQPERAQAFRQLKPREREALFLKALGYSYNEIARLTDSTYTAVNRRLTEGRARLRRLARDRGEEPGDASDDEDSEGARAGGGGL